MSFKIAFIGVGNMGAPMASNLKKAGHSVSVFDLSPHALEAAAQRGLSAAKNLSDCIKDADFIISMLPATQHVLSLYQGSEGLFKIASKKSFLIDCSTISPSGAREVYKTAKSNGFSMIDAPVSGGVGGAEAGTLSFMVGGAHDEFKKAQPILSLMGKNIFHAGESGAGQVAKVCNNMLLAIHMIGTSEALALGSKLGMDPKILSEIMSKSSGRNWSLEVYNPWPKIMENIPSSRDYNGGFGTDLMLKDLGLAQEAALEAKASTPLGSLARNLYATHSAQGSGKLDFSSIINFIKGALK